MASRSSTISSIFDSLDLIASGQTNTNGDQQESSTNPNEVTVSGITTSASAMLLAKRREDSDSRSAIKFNKHSLAPKATSLIFDRVSASSVAAPKYWGGASSKSSTKKSSSSSCAPHKSASRLAMRAKVEHITKPKGKAGRKKREKAESYADKREWKQQVKGGK